MKEILSSPKSKKIREQEVEEIQQQKKQSIRFMSEQKMPKVQNCLSPRGSPRQLHEMSYTESDNKKVEINENHNIDSSNQACLICFEGIPDAFYTPCGHGGVCYECAIELMKKTEECFLCREVPVKNRVR